MKKKIFTGTSRLLLRKERIRTLAQTEFHVVDGGDATTHSKETNAYTSVAATQGMPTTCD
jgi:hypothetical protein